MNWLAGWDFPSRLSPALPIPIAQLIFALQRAAKGIELKVEDNGCGIQAPPREGSLGRRLIAAFVQEARGELVTESSPSGTRCTVLLK